MVLPPAGDGSTPPEGPPTQIPGQLTLFGLDEPPPYRLSASDPTVTGDVMLHPPPTRYVMPAAGRYEFTFGNPDVFRRFTLYTWGSIVLVAATATVFIRLNPDFDPSEAAAVKTMFLALIGVIARIYLHRLHDRFRRWREHRRDQRRR